MSEPLTKFSMMTTGIRRFDGLIHIAAVAVRAGRRRADLAAMHYVFPTLAGSVFDAMWE